MASVTEFVILVFLFAIIINPGLTYGKTSSCIGCHDLEASEWEGSIHKDAGVTCVKCMGGDPLQAEKEVAHSGMALADVTEDMDLYRTIPQMCGECHKVQYEAFRFSPHYQNLIHAGFGPDCTTCHGSHDVSLVEPLEIVTKCETCHNEEIGAPVYVPLEASQSLVILQEVRDNIAIAEKEIVEAKAQGLDVKEPEKYLEKARTSLLRAIETWHLFDLRIFRIEIEDAVNYSKASLDMLLAPGQKGERETPTPYKPYTPKRKICGPTFIMLLTLLPLLLIRLSRSLKQG